MPKIKSQAQRGLVHAVAEGKSTAMPKSVAKAAIAEDKGGKLPKHVTKKKK